MRELIDNGLWDIKLYLMKKYGVDASDREIEPLAWYITTGRASTEFIRKVFSYKPFVIARILHNSNTYDEAIDRLKKYVYKDN